MRFVKCSFERPGGARYITPLVAVSWERAWIEVWIGWLNWLFVWQVRPLKNKESAGTSTNTRKRQANASRSA